jgi:hypothetical protein
MLFDGMGEGSAADAAKLIHLVGTVAVVVIAVLFDKGAIFADGQQSVDIVMVVHPCNLLTLGGNSAAVISGEIA